MAKYYEYGMRLRGYSPGCQPMQGLMVARMESGSRYHENLIYDRELSERELEDYELDFIRELTWDDYLKAAADTIGRWKQAAK